MSIQKIVFVKNMPEESKHRIRRTEPIEWYGELGDDSACESVLEALGDRVEQIRKVYEDEHRNFDNITPKKETTSLVEQKQMEVAILENNINMLSRFVDDVKTLREMGFWGTGERRAKGRILKKLDELLKEERTLRGIPEGTGKIIDIDSSGVIKTDNVGILSDHELEVVEQANEYLQKKWKNARLKPITKEEVIAAIKKKKPIDL